MDYRKPLQNPQARERHLAKVHALGDSTLSKAKDWMERREQQGRPVMLGPDSRIAGQIDWPKAATDRRK